MEVDVPEPPLSAFASHYWPKRRTWWYAAISAAAGVVALVLSRSESWRVLGVVLLLVAAVFLAAPAFRRRRLRSANRRDYQASRQITEEFEKLGWHRLRNGEPRDLLPESLKVLTGLLLVGVEWQVGQQMAASVEHWLAHRLGLPGGTDPGLPSFAGDSFVVIFEKTEGAGEYIRVVATSGWWGVEILTEAVRRLAAPYMSGTHTHEAIVAGAGRAISSFPFGAGQLSSRLGTLLRLPADERPGASTTGAFVGPGTLLAGAVHLDDETDWRQVFPVALVEEINSIVEEHPPTFRIVSVYGSSRPRMEILPRTQSRHSL
jgi:hypothetical protein